jgi:hypothetical protein
MQAASNEIGDTSRQIKFTEDQKRKFWEKVDKCGPTMPHMDSPCWMWLGSKIYSGHGQLRAIGRTVQAHRAMWTLVNGSIELNGEYRGACVCHKCDNPPCVNPDHLFIGSHADNIQDMIKKGRFRKKGMAGTNVKLP